ncbi:MAG: hypothetical protein ACLSUT_01945 [Christensenellales bacterium]
MSDAVLFLACIGAGLAARAVLIPAKIIAKKYGALVTIICDVCFAFLAGVPFAALLLFFRSGILGYFMAAGFLIGLALPICLQPALNAVKRRRENQKEQKIR